MHGESDISAVRPRPELDIQGNHLLEEIPMTNDELTKEEFRSLLESLPIIGNETADARLSKLSRHNEALCRKIEQLQRAQLIPA
ncbi:protein of unknown function [Nitrospira japonica]|uniref:Uncharacterized protein n=2 Tax=Nitrospira japonica TaxID=1325564 RepID=A0A1W1I007_9BACT|nr:protein of unknown function [Nitrospira japonica]